MFNITKISLIGIVFLTSITVRAQQIQKISFNEFVKSHSSDMIFIHDNAPDLYEKLKSDLNAIKDNQNAINDLQGNRLIQNAFVQLSGMIQQPILQQNRMPLNYFLLINKIDLTTLQTNPDLYNQVRDDIKAVTIDKKIDPTEGKRIVQNALHQLGQMPQAPQPSTSTSTRSSSTQPRPTTMLKIADIKKNPQLLEQMFPQEMDEFKTVATSDYAVRKADFINIELAEHANAHEGMISKKDIQEMLQNKIRSLELMFDYTIDSGASSTSNVTSTIPRSSSTQPRSTTMQQTTMLKIADIKNNPQLLEQMFPQEMDEFKKLFKDNYEVRKQINLIPAIEKRADSNGVIGKKDIQEVVQQQINGFKRALNLGPLNKKAGSTSTTTPITSRSSSTQPAPTASENTEIIHLNCYYDIITGAYDLGSLFPEELEYINMQFTKDKKEEILREFKKYFPAESGLIYSPQQKKEREAKGDEIIIKLASELILQPLAQKIYADKSYDSDTNTIGYNIIKKILWKMIYEKYISSGKGERPDFMPKNWRPGDPIPPSTSRSSCQPPAPAPTPRPGQQFSKLSPAYLEEELQKIYQNRFIENPIEKLNQFDRFQREKLFKAIKERNLLKDSPYWDPVYQAIYPNKKVIN